MDAAVLLRLRVNGLFPVGFPIDEGFSGGVIPFIGAPSGAGYAEGLGLGHAGRLKGHGRSDGIDENILRRDADPAAEVIAVLRQKAAQEVGRRCAAAVARTPQLDLAGDAVRADIGLHKAQDLITGSQEALVDPAGAQIEIAGPLAAVARVPGAYREERVFVSFAVLHRLPGDGAADGVLQHDILQVVSVQLNVGKAKVFQKRPDLGTVLVRIVGEGNAADDGGERRQVRIGFRGILQEPVVAEIADVGVSRRTDFLIKERDQLGVR